MTTNPGPFELKSVPLVLGPGGAATPKPMSPLFYQELDSEFARFAGHVLVSEHSFAAPWPAWEMHPKGDELVYLLEGDVEFVLATAAGERIVRLDEPGQYALVPRGAWHTARPRKPSRMLFVTPGEGTRHAEKPGGGSD